MIRAAADRLKLLGFTAPNTCEEGMLEKPLSAEEQRQIYKYLCVLLGAHELGEKIG